MCAVLIVYEPGGWTAVTTIELKGAELPGVAAFFAAIDSLVSAEDGTFVDGQGQGE
jgi:hypothetical protein